jgi:hypothetical protein
MNLKTFSQQSRRILIRGIAQKLLYWGFDAKGNVTEEPTTLEGGYVLRGEAFDDSSIPGKWNRLRDAIQQKGIESVTEEAAYTWFNRIMAIRILSKNGYDRAQLEYEGDSKTPTLLTRARRGQSEFLAAKEKKRLQVVLTDYAKEREAFAILLTGYCEHHQLLKSIFGRLDDYTELLLPDDILEESGVIHLLNTTDAISDSDYQKVELIGWLYQFYISERKDEVFASFKKNKKAEAKDIPAATQIFTPNWIVKYMVENTIGKLWLDLNPDSELKSQMAYLIDDPAQKQAPIISEAAQLKLLDPAVGSGHILVEGFDLLYAMYQEEYYTAEEAVKSILDKNLFGLDIDTRAAQLARFAVLLKAAKYYPEVLSKGWMPQIYAMPEPVFFNRQEILDFLGKDGLDYEEELTESLKLMRESQNLGSTMMIDWSKNGREFMLRRLKELQNQTFQDLTTQLLLNRITSYIQIAGILTDQYEGVAANPPYLGYKFLNGSLKQYVENHYPNTKSDLFAVFQEVIGQIGKRNGKRGIINQWAWMCIDSYKNFRENFIENYHTESLLHLGIGVFKELNTKKVQNVALIFTNRNDYIRLTRCFKLDETFDVLEKERLFLNREKEILKDFKEFQAIPNTPLAFWLNTNFVNLYKDEIILDDVLSPRVGLQTGDNDRFVRNWHEVSFSNIKLNASNKTEAKNSAKKWFPYNKGGGYNKWYGNNFYVVNWANDGNEIKNNFNENGALRSRPQNEHYYFREGVSWSLISLTFSARYTDTGYLFDVGGSSGFPKKQDLLYSISLLNSKVSSYVLAGLNFTLNVQVGDIKRILFVNPEEDKKKQIEDLSTKLISLSKKDFDYSELSREFENHILIDYNDYNLESAYSNCFNQISEDTNLFYLYERKINSAFIKLYNLEGELDPEPDIKYLTIYQDYISGIVLNEEQLVISVRQDYIVSSLINYAIGLNMGRYRLDKPGLHIAHPDPSTDELTVYAYKEHSFQIDEDGIIPLMGSAASFSDDALTRVKSFLEIVWGADTLTQNLNFLQECLDDDLENYLVKKYWKDHCQTYKKKPIYWLFTSEKGAFQVLVYMHRMNAFTVEKIRSNYLMPFLKQLRSQIDRLESSGEDPRLLDRLLKNLTESEAYELLLKDTADKQITFDLDDGVTKNYELFEGVVGKVK